MLDMHNTQEIIDLIHGPILYSGLEKEIIATPFFNRLHKILQSSLVYLTYPSNKVKRFEHSLGTMHLAGQYFFKAVCNSDKKQLNTFFEEAFTEIEIWYNTIEEHKPYYISDSVFISCNKDLHSLPFPNNLLYKQNTPSNLSDDNLFAYYVMYQSVRLAGMLHDIGHLPYSHVLESALNRLYHQVLNIPENEKNDAHRYFLDVMKVYCDDTIVEDPNKKKHSAIHEELGKHLVNKIFESITNKLTREENPEVFFLSAVIYFTKKILSSAEGGEENNFFSDLHAIVAGTLDCDRMDYCCRDSFCSGLSKELPQYGRIFSTLQVVYRCPEDPLTFNTTLEERNHFHFAPSTKALLQIENLLENRWNIYASINYHHNVHKHELLMENIIAQMGLDEMSSGTPPEKIYFILPLEISSIWQLIAQMKDSTPIEYVALQLDDSWLDTLLKHKYFNTYQSSYLSFVINGKDTKWHILDELISSKKHYHSLIKRSGGFRTFDEDLYNNLKEEDYINCFGIDSTKTYSKVLGQGEYVFNKIISEIASNNKDRECFFLELEKRIKIEISRNNYNISDCLIGDAYFKPGIKQSSPIFITSPETAEKPFSNYSSLYKILNTKQKLLPSFHVYYLPEYDIHHGEYMQPKLDEFKKVLAKTTAQLIIETSKKAT